MTSIRIVLTAIFLCGCCAPAWADAAADILTVIGAKGTDEYGKDFQRSVEVWRGIATSAAARFDLIGTDISPTPSDRDRLQKILVEKQEPTTVPLWLVLIGHGTWDGTAAKFNLRGLDVSATELGEWLKSIDRPIVVVNTASSSGPFVNRLSGPNRVVVTATKSGVENNLTRFGTYFSRAMATPESDLDHDDEVSVHEAFLRASREVEKFYESEGRLSTEHALIDDNGDGRGTPAKMFRGTRPIGKAQDGVALDGRRAARMTLAQSGKTLSLTVDEKKRRDEIEARLDELRDQRGSIEDQAYFVQIEPLMIELAKIYRAAESR